MKSLNYKIKSSVNELIASSNHRVALITPISLTNHSCKQQKFILRLIITFLLFINCDSHIGTNLRHKTINYTYFLMTCFR